MNRAERRATESRASKLPEAKVCIGIPSNGVWVDQFGMCLIKAIIDLLSNPTPGFGPVSFRIHNTRGSILPKQRTDLIKMAIEDSCTHLFFVDSDQTFPARTIRWLLHRKEKVVAANVAIKQFPSMPTARKKVNGEPYPVFTLPESEGLERVWRIGTGIMMIDLKIMPKIAKPWFDTKGDAHGEDWWFCEKIEEAGIPIYIDHDISFEVGHVGPMEFTHNHVTPEVIKLATELLAEGISDVDLGAVLHTRLEAQALEQANGS